MVSVFPPHLGAVGVEKTRPPLPGVAGVGGPGFLTGTLLFLAQPLKFFFQAAVQFLFLLLLQLALIGFTLGGGL